MGRTLHYEVINRQEIARDERELIKTIAASSTQGPWAELWTCESFDLNPETLRGFSKVLDDEFNAALVYLTLLAISEKTKALISLYDEGSYLRIPILIRGGKAKPWMTRAAESWAHWEESGLLRIDGCGTQTRMKKQLELIERFAGEGFGDPERFCEPVLKLRDVPTLKLS